MLAGTPAAEAFAPWNVGLGIENDAEELRASLAELGGSSLEFFGYKLRLALQRRDGSGLEVQTAIVFPGSQPISLVELRVSPDTSPRGIPVTKPPPGTEMAVSGARAFARELRSKRCEQLPIPDPAQAWPDAPFLEEVAEDLNELRDELPGLCEQAGGKGLALTHVELDQFGFLVRNDQGRLVAVVTGTLEIGPAGVQVHLEGLDVLPDPPPTPAPAPSAAGDRTTPHATWETLRAAVAARDLDTYAACFVEASREREGAVGELRVNPGLWEELDGLLQGPQQLTAEISGDRARCRVEAPEADDGGIGGLTMERVGGEWLIASW